MIRAPPGAGCSSSPTRTSASAPSTRWSQRHARANAKARREAGGDEAAALATSQMLAAAPKDRSADLMFAIVLHHPALKSARSRLRSVSVDRRLEWVADPTLSCRERALAAWHSSGVEERGEPRVGPGDLGGLMRTYSRARRSRAAARGRRPRAEENTRAVRFDAALALACGRRGREEFVDFSLARLKSDQRRPALRH